MQTPAKKPEMRPAFDPDKLIASVDPELFALFKSGHILNVNHYAVPANYWLSPGEDRNVIAYHWPERTCPSHAFTLFSEGAQAVGNDANTLAYRYSEAKYQEARARWALLKTMVDERMQLFGTVTLKAWQLSPDARKCAQQLKSNFRHLGRNVTMQDEGVDELVAMGLAIIQPEGYVRASSELMGVAIPRGKTTPN